MNVLAHGMSPEVVLAHGMYGWKEGSKEDILIPGSQLGWTDGAASRCGDINQCDDMLSRQAMMYLPTSCCSLWMHRGRSEGSLTGLRSRATSLLLQLLQTAAFNPQAASMAGAHIQPERFMYGACAVPQAA